jgi:putative copper resistance protein D
MALEVLVAAGYLLGVHRLAIRGRRWPRQRTASFLGGVFVLVIALQSGLASLDDIFAVHNVQHLALMMVAPPLLVAGAPLALGLAAGGPILRRAILSIVRDPSMRLADGRFGTVASALDYYGTMFLYLLSPLFTVAAAHPVVHSLVHLYVFACGVVFWHELIGTSTRRCRRSPLLSLVKIALGVPAMTALGLLVAWRGPAIAPGMSSAEVVDGAVTLIVGGALATGIGLAITAIELRRRRARGPTMTKLRGAEDATLPASMTEPGLRRAQLS